MRLTPVAFACAVAFLLSCAGPVHLTVLDVESRLDPYLVAEDVRVDEGCAKLFDYCVQVHCAIRNRAEMPQQGKVNVAFQQGAKTAALRERMLELEAGEVAYLDEKFDEATILGGLTLSGVCAPEYQGVLVTCDVKNAGGPGRAEVLAELIYEDGTSDTNSIAVDFGEGERKKVQLRFPRLDALRAECRVK